MSACCLCLTANATYNLEFDCLAIQLNRPDFLNDVRFLRHLLGGLQAVAWRSGSTYEVYADSRDVGLGVGIISEPQQ